MALHTPDGCSGPPAYRRKRNCDPARAVQDIADRPVKLATFDTFDVVDQSGLPVLFEPLQNGKSLGTFCGKTSRPVKAAKAWAAITVYLYVGMCGSTPSVPSDGGIRVIVSK